MIKRTIFLQVALLLCIAVMGQNTTTLIFTGTDQNGQGVSLNNITVENVTRQWQIPLVYPDTVLILNNLVGIDDSKEQTTAVILTVHPNPFNGTTEAELLLKDGGSAHFKISDMNGREAVALTTPFLPAGNHHFRITLATPQTYILTVTQNGNSASVKLVNASDGGTNAISYFGTTSTGKMPMLFSSNPFTPGDLMRYMGFVQRNGSTFSDVITQYQNGDDIIIFKFTLPDIIPPVLCHDTLIPQTGAMCHGATYVWRGKTLTTAGTYYDSLKTTIGGCDSVYCLTLSYLPNSTSVENVTICPGSTYIWHNKTISTAGLHLDTIPAANGCDSICKLTVTIGATYFNSKTDSIALGNTYSWHGKTYSIAGTYYDSLKTVDGCDSIFQLNLSVVTTLTFTCGLSVATDTDGNMYNTVKLGTQCWMKENLKTTRFPDGTTIPASSSSSTVLPYLYVPNKDTLNIPNYGYLYNWTAAMNSSSAGDYTVQGICPDGWHLPSINEWKTLINYMKGVMSYKCNNSSTYIAKAASSQVGWTTATQTCAVGNDLSQNNMSGFSAMPAGLVSGNYTTYFGTDCKMWSTEEFLEDCSEASTAYLQNTSATFNTVTGIWSKGYGFSVRCVYGNGGKMKVSTSSVSNIGANSATCGGNVSVDGGDAITARGVCWSTSSGPTIADAHTTDGNGLGSFTSSLSGLTPLTPYYVRAYSTNSFGTAYGEEVIFVIPNANDGAPCTGAATVTDADGITYNTIQLGSQCWMKQNLRTTTYTNGTSIQYGGANTSPGTAYYYYPNNDVNSVASLGLLYNVAAVFNGANSSTANPSGVQGICPTGWHLPSRAEWTQLTDYVSANTSFQCNGLHSNYAKSMCATSGWYSTGLACTPGSSQANNNASGFSIVPAGYFDGSNYATAGQHANFWTSYKSGSNAYYVQFSYFYTNSYQWSDANYEAKSVRCVKD